VNAGNLQENRMTGISIWKLLLFLLVILLLFSSRLPSLARSLGQSITEFKRGFKELQDQSENEKSE
jgi:sec-independent protein translocase protein TatA